MVEIVKCVPVRIILKRGNPLSQTRPPDIRDPPELEYQLLQMSRPHLPTPHVFSSPPDE